MQQVHKNYMQSLALNCIQQARKNIQREKPMMVDSIAILTTPEDDALWLLTEARDMWFPVAFGENSEDVWRIVRSEVLQSPGFKSLTKKMLDEKTYAEQLDRYQIWW
jgi:hypothetical protein